LLNCNVKGRVSVLFALFHRKPASLGFPVRRYSLLQRTILPALAGKTHVCRLRSVFPRRMSSEKTYYTDFSPAGEKLCEANIISRGNNVKKP